MVYRYSWLAGFSALLFAFYQLNELLRPTVEGPPWQFVVLAGLALGIIITWTVLAYRLNGWIVVGLNLVASLIAVSRVAAPDTTALVLPTASTFTELRTQFDQAFEIVRNGVEPVLPVSGIVVLLMVLLWAVGGLFAWGLTTGHPYIALVPPLVLSLQFATMDRAATGWTRAAVFVLLIAGTMLAITTDERDQTTGRMARRGEWPSSRSRIAPAASALLAFTLVASVSAVTLLEDSVPRDGVLEWRATTGLTGDFFGSVSYNPFVGIRQQLVSNSEEPVFLARITGDVPTEGVYFRLLTLETYNGGQFFANRPEVFRLEDQPWESSRHAFAGPERTITTEVQIERLRMDWLPAAYTPIDVASTNSVERSLRARREDGSLILDGGLSFRGMQYSVRSEVPTPDIDLLAVTPEGTLSPSFQLALDADEQLDIALPEPARIEAATRSEPPNVELYLQVPQDDAEARMGQIEALAARITANLVTDFEKGLALEAWFHSPFTGSGDPTDGFRYTTDIDPGHGATDLAAWLLDPDSPNYHAGYCENFSTAMAMMARTLGIPSRVVLGFTPGEPTGQEDVVVVRDRNAHAWVELWMPTQGWVRFDPTPRNLNDTPQTIETVEETLGFDFSSYLDIPDPDTPDLPNAGSNLFEPFEDGLVPVFVGGGDFQPANRGFSVPGWLQVALVVVGGLAVVLGAVPGVKLWRRRRRMRRLRQGDVTAAWEEIVARLTDLGDRPDATKTPDEYAAQVDRAMAPLATAYGRAVYGPPDAVEDHHVSAAASSLSSTTQRLTTRYSRTQRLLAWYRPSTVLPRWTRRRSRR